MADALLFVFAVVRLSIPILLTPEVEVKLIWEFVPIFPKLPPTTLPILNIEFLNTESLTIQTFPSAVTFSCAKVAKGIAKVSKVVMILFIDLSGFVVILLEKGNLGAPIVMGAPSERE